MAASGLTAATALMAASGLTAATALMAATGLFCSANLARSFRQGPGDNHRQGNQQRGEYS